MHIHLVLQVIKLLLDARLPLLHISVCLSVHTLTVIRLKELPQGVLLITVVQKYLLEVGEVQNVGENLVDISLVHFR